MVSTGSLWWRWIAHHIIQRCTAASQACLCGPVVHMAEQVFHTMVHVAHGHGGYSPRRECIGVWPPITHKFLIIHHIRAAPTEPPHSNYNQEMVNWSDGLCIQAFSRIYNTRVVNFSLTKNYNTRVVTLPKTPVQVPLEQFTTRVL